MPVLKRSIKAAVVADGGDDKLPLADMYALLRPEAELKL